MVKVRSLSNKNFHSFFESFLNSFVKSSLSILIKRRNKTNYTQPTSKQIKRRKKKIKKRIKLHLEGQHSIHAQSKFFQFLQNQSKQPNEEGFVRTEQKEVQKKKTNEKRKQIITQTITSEQQRQIIRKQQIQTLFRGSTLDPCSRRIFTVSSQPFSTAL